MGKLATTAGPLVRIIGGFMELSPLEMTVMNAQVRLLVDWKGLVAMGWPYSRVHTWRMMRAGEFAQACKLGKHRNSHPVWRLHDVIEWFRTYGLDL